MTEKIGIVVLVLLDESQRLPALCDYTLHSQTAEQVESGHPKTVDLGDESSRSFAG